MQKKLCHLLILATVFSGFLTACSEDFLDQLLDENAVSSPSEENSQTTQEETPSNTGLMAEAPASSVQQEILERVNQERQQAGIVGLALNAVLSKAAQSHAENMIKTGVFAHEIDGKNVGDRASKAGYHWGRIGENIASGQKSPEAVMLTWMNSEGHRKNILKADFKELGVGYAKDSDGTPYWVQVFGTPF